MTGQRHPDDVRVTTVGQGTRQRIAPGAGSGVRVALHSGVDDVRAHPGIEVAETKLIAVPYDVAPTPPPVAVVPSAANVGSGDVVPVTAVINAPVADCRVIVRWPTGYRL